MNKRKAEKAEKTDYDYRNDGEDHINILARKAKTLLGHRLSHFAHSPFTHPYYGVFQSMESFWHYASTGYIHEELRDEVGFKAKKAAEGLRKVWYTEFTEDIMVANYQKIMQDPSLSQLMIESELPFTHYYLMPDEMNPGRIKMVTPRESRWLVKGFEDIRTALKQGTIPEFWDRALMRYATNVANGRPAHRSR